MRKHTRPVRENRTRVVKPMLHRNIVSIEFLFIFLCPTAAFRVCMGREDAAFPVAVLECIVFMEETLLRNSSGAATPLRHFNLVVLSPASCKTPFLQVCILQTCRGRHLDYVIHPPFSRPQLYFYCDYPKMRHAAEKNYPRGVCRFFIFDIGVQRFAVFCAVRKCRRQPFGFSVYAKIEFGV